VATRPRGSGRGEPTFESQIVNRLLVFVTSIVATAVWSFALGVIHTGRANAAERMSYHDQIDELRAEMRTQLGPVQRRDAVLPAGTIGATPTKEQAAEPAPSISARATMVAEIKQQLQSEMGLIPVRLLRDRRTSFVELHSSDDLGTKYGTAGYLGNGYFITVKHAVVALKDDDNRRSVGKITGIKIVYRGKEIPARVVDAGDADVEVHRGDWAIIKTAHEIDLPALHVDTSYGYEFADPIFRLGNDYSKGIIASTGYVGQHTANGLITCLTDGHPGVSGGGVLNQRGDLVGIPIGRMQDDFRFSFILPLRAEMFRKFPSYEPPAMPSVVATEPQ
jgi:Trypsin-like peptidase domain